MDLCYEIYSEVDLHGHCHVFGILSRFLSGQRENHVHDS
jgi:hypothetical protein